MSDIPTKRCLDCGIEQPVWDFYENSKTSDGLNVYCKICQRRRSTASVYRGRAVRKAQAEAGPTDYLDRHLQRRAEESTDCLEQAGPMERRGLCRIEPEYSYSSLCGLVNDFLRVGKPRPTYPRA